MFEELPEACDNTLRIAERVELDLVFGDRAPAEQRFHLPRFEVPPGKDARRLPPRAHRSRAPASGTSDRDRRRSDRGSTTSSP